MRRARRELPSVEEIKRHFEYDAAQGALIWKPRLISTRGWNKKYAGTRAGTVTNGYIVININGTLYRAHRLIFKLAYGYVPYEIDHINHNGADNRLVNLRPATTSLNQGNRLRQKNNGTGYKGVKFHKRDRVYEARCRGRLIGSFKTAAEAHQAYCQAAKREFGEFFNPG